MDDVWEFAKGCMRSYLILKEKAKQYNADPEIQAILVDLNAGDSSVDPILTSPYSKANAAALRGMSFDPNVLAQRSLPYEKLDQLVFDLLMGVR
jgi:xylose isomerase